MSKSFNGGDSAEPGRGGFWGSARQTMSPLLLQQLGPCQAANRLCTERPLCGLQCPFTLDAKSSHKCSNENLQVQPFFRTVLAFPFRGNCSWVARACICVHAAHTWIPNCERFPFSWAGSQMLSCFNANYSPVTSLWGQEKGLIALFSCLVPPGLRWNKGKSDSLPSKSSYPTGSLALSFALESEFIHKAQGSSSLAKLSR